MWQVCWAHPKFGNIIASCSYDKRVIIWKEEPNRQWGVVWDSAQANLHDSSGMARFGLAGEGEREGGRGVRRQSLI